MFGLLVLPAQSAFAKTSGVLPTIDHPQGTDRDLLRFFTKDGLRTIARATRVEVFGLDGADWRAPRRAIDDKRLWGYRLTRRRLAASSDLAVAIKTAVLTPSNYRFPVPPPDLKPGEVWGQGKGCGGFSPGVAFRFSIAGQASSQIVLLCFNCDDLGIPAGRSPSANPPVSAPEDLFSIVDITPGRSVLLSITKQALSAIDPVPARH